MLAAALVIAIAAPFLTGGNTLGHVFSHLIPATVAASLALAVSRLRRAPTARAALLAFLLVVSAAQIMEAIGAFGWDELGLFEDRPVLTALHDVALAGPAAALFAAVVTGIVVAFRRRGDPGPGPIP